MIEPQVELLVVVAVLEPDVVVLLNIEVRLGDEFLLFSSVERVSMLINGQGHQGGDQTVWLQHDAVKELVEIQVRLLPLL